MLQSLVIKNFKSIKNLHLECKRVNLFIGDPNSGKSNILEAFGLLNFCADRTKSNSNSSLADHVRFEIISQLFYDFNSSLTAEVKVDSYKVTSWIEDNELRLESHLGLNSPFLIKLKLNGQFVSSSVANAVKAIPKIHSYRFRQDIKYRENEIDSSYLEAPFGVNLSSVVLYNRDLLNQIQNLLQGLGYKMLFRTYETQFEILREKSGLSIAFPLSVISDTVRRMIFFLTAIESNNNCAVIFEEPESNTFPLYIKYLAEKVGAYSKNQYFMTTHNPYFLQTIIEKTPQKDLSINLVEMKDYNTKVTPLKKRGVSEILGLNSDVFLNFNVLK